VSCKGYPPARLGDLKAVPNRLLNCALSDLNTVRESSDMRDQQREFSVARSVQGRFNGYILSREGKASQCPKSILTFIIIRFSFLARKHSGVAEISLNAVILTLGNMLFSTHEIEASRKAQFFQPKRPPCRSLNVISSRTLK